MTFVIPPDTGEEIVVLYGQSATLIEEIENALVVKFQKLDDLDVISEVHLGDVGFESFPLQGVLLADKDLFKVDLVDLLVGIVHAQLLETVRLEHLEPVDIKQLYLSTRGSF